MLTLLDDKAFSLESQPAIGAHQIAMELSRWIPGHEDEASCFERKLVTSLCTCFSARGRSQKVRREKMWASYHTLRCSETYHGDWQSFLQSSIKVEFSPIFCQYVGHCMFKELVKLHHPLTQTASATSNSPLTYDETNALRYAAGYVPRLLKKKLKKSKHPLREDIQLCLLDLLDDGDEENDESQDWVSLINRGGLTLVNNATFEVFVAIEYELRKHIHYGQSPNLDRITTAILDNEDVLFLWSMLSSDWAEDSAGALLQMLVNQWIKIRGFSCASAWLEEFKVSQKKTTQKTKGIRKHLTSQPKTTSAAQPSSPKSDSNSDSD